MSGNVYEESRGVMKIFMEAVVKDAIIYVTHCDRKTVTTMDVIYALKHHGHTLFGFTCPYSYSRKLDLKPSAKDPSGEDPQSDPKPQPKPKPKPKPRANPKK